MTNHNSDGNYSRRKLLKSTGVALGATALPATASATPGPKSKFERTIEQSHHVKDKTGSMDKWRQFLRNRGISVASVNQRYSLSDDGPSTDHYKDSKYLDITMSLSVDCYSNYYADLTWTYEEDGAWLHDAQGAPPLDAAGISYNQDWWNLTDDTISGTTSMSEYVSYADGSYGGNGPGFEMDDNSMSYNGDDGNLHWGGVFLQAIGDFDSNERQVFGDYVHTWKEGKLERVTVSYPGGISVDLAPETESWKTDTEKDGDQLLKVKQSEATFTGGC